MWFGLKLYSNQYVETFEKRVTRLEREVEYWQKRYDAEVMRADRLSDALIESHGHLPATETSRGDYEKRKAAADTLWDKREDELNEIYADTIGNLVGDDDEMIVPESLVEAAKTAGLVT